MEPNARPMRQLVLSWTLAVVGCTAQVADGVEQVGAEQNVGSGCPSCGDDSLPESLVWIGEHLPLERQGDFDVVCTGTLVRSDVVLTSSQCIEDMQLPIVGWSRDYQRDFEMQYAHVRAIESVCAEGLATDAPCLALMFLDRDTGRAPATLSPRQWREVRELPVVLAGHRGSLDLAENSNEAVQCSTETALERPDLIEYPVDYPSIPEYVWWARKSRYGYGGGPAFELNAEGQPSGEVFAVNVGSNAFSGDRARACLAQNTEYIAVYKYVQTIEQLLNARKTPVDACAGAMSAASSGNSTILNEIKQREHSIVHAELSDAADVRRYEVEIKDTGWFGFAPSVVLSADAIADGTTSFEVCAYFIREGEQQSVPGCDVDVTHDMRREVDGQEHGCCSHRALILGEPVEWLRLSGVDRWLNDDSGTFYVRVRAVGGSVCGGSYSLDIRAQ